MGSGFTLGAACPTPDKVQESIGKVKDFSFFPQSFRTSTDDSKVYFFCSSDVDSSCIQSDLRKIYFSRNSIFVSQQAQRGKPFFSDKLVPTVALVHRYSCVFSSPGALNASSWLVSPAQANDEEFSRGGGNGNGNDVRNCKKLLQI